jgi:hypothetical protein
VVVGHGQRILDAHASLTLRAAVKVILMIANGSDSDVFFL